MVVFFRCDLFSLNPGVQIQKIMRKEDLFMKFYEEAKMEVISFNAEDIITTSDDNELPGLD